MNHFIIENTASAHVFGIYEAVDGDEAIRVMLRDSGDDQGETDDLKATDLRHVEGRAAVRYAKARGLSYSEAEGICAEDPSLVRLEVAS